MPDKSTELNRDIILIEKPKGITSFDCIRKLRSKTGIKKMGHAGTLDPNATGLMIIGINEGTKKLDDYLKLDKTYIVDILLGEKRDTGDAEGKLIEGVKVPEITQKKIQKALKSLEGELELHVPAYSAIKVKGRKLYEKARAGEDFARPIRKMKVYNIELLNTERKGDKILVQTKMKVASGTYVRSIAEKFGEFLGYPACITDLRRTRVGEFGVEEAEKL